MVKHAQWKCGKYYTQMYYVTLCIKECMLFHMGVTWCHVTVTRLLSKDWGSCWCFVCIAFSLSEKIHKESHNIISSCGSLYSPCCRSLSRCPVRPFETKKPMLTAAGKIVLRISLPFMSKPSIQIIYCSQRCHLYNPMFFPLSREWHSRMQ